MFPQLTVLAPPQPPRGKTGGRAAHQHRRLRHRGPFGTRRLLCQRRYETKYYTPYRPLFKRGFLMMRTEIFLPIWLFYAYKVVCVFTFSINIKYFYRAPEGHFGHQTLLGLSKETARNGFHYRFNCLALPLSIFYSNLSHVCRMRLVSNVRNSASD